MRMALWTLLPCCLVLLFAPGLAQQPPHRGRINVAFEFQAGETKFPAGEYLLYDITSTRGLLRSADGKLRQTLYFSQSGEPENNPRVVFAVRNDKYYFSAIVGWFGRMQYTGFSPHAEDGTKEVPIVSSE